MKLSIKTATALFGAVIAVGFVFVVAVNLLAQRELAIGGAAYERIIYAKDLTADILPPPAYVIESFLESTLALNSPDSASARRERIVQLHAEYNDRIAFWKASNLEPELKSDLTVHSDNEVTIFWDIAERELFPALFSNDLEAAHDAYGRLTAAYSAHRAVIDEIVTGALIEVSTETSDAASEKTKYSWAVWSTSAIVMLVLAGGVAGLMLWVVQPMGRMTQVMRRLAGGELDVEIPCTTRRDELGAMAKAVDVFKQNAGAVVKASEDDKRKAQEGEAVIAAIGAGLDAIANGDLTHRVTEDLSGLFAKLKTDYNDALQQLQDSMKTVMSSVGGISTGAGEISQSSDDLSRRTEQQAASLEETAAALEEITATVKTTAANAKEASGIVATAKSAAEDGGRVVETAITAMDQIEQSSKQITDIIGVIDEIAFQTNLLALNAGVEAARAGDAGRGFAVVASEVRALAQRSSEAAKEIKGLIKTSSEHVGSGVKLVGESGEALKRIVGEVIKINALVGDIAQASQQQSTGIEEVNAAVNQMDQMTQQNAAMVEESTAASRNLADETAELSRQVARFNVGAAASLARAPAPVVRASNRSPVARLRANGSAAVAVAAKTQSAEPDWQDF